MMVAVTLWVGIGLDLWLGEPRRHHPLVLFGRLAGQLARYLNRPGTAANQVRGVLAWGLAVLPWVGLAMWIRELLPWPWLWDALLLYLALGLRSLGEHLRPVIAALEQGDLAYARQRVAWLVSRDTQTMDAQEVARAATESALENGSDAVFASIFWCVLLGAPGVVLHRLSNTLDAMWGYRTPELRQFGWAAARLDDGLNYLPARLTALTYGLQGKTKLAWHCWQVQAPQWDSPNAGPVMAAGAGALGIQLGGKARYHGHWVSRPPLGQGAAPEAASISAALKLVQQGVLWWLVILTVGGALCA